MSSCEHLKPIVIQSPLEEGALDDFFKSVETFGNRAVTDEVRIFCERVASGEVPERLPAELSSYAEELSPASIFISSFLQSAGYYARATKELANYLSVCKLGTVLDPLAGSGFMVKALREAGVPTIATDDYSWGFQGPAEKLDALTSLRKYGSQIDTVLISWAPPGSTLDMELWNLAREEFPHLNFVVISEGKNGCTGSNEFAEFHELWELVEAYETTYGLFDYCALFFPAELED